MTETILLLAAAAAPIVAVFVSMLLLFRSRREVEHLSAEVDKLRSRLIAEEARAFGAAAERARAEKLQASADSESTADHAQDAER